MSGTIHDLRTLTSEAEWSELEPEWNELLGRSASSSIFQTWEWVRTWWQAYAAFAGADGLHILVARDGEGLAGIAPFYRTRTRGVGLGALRTLRFIGSGSDDSDYLDFIVAAGKEDAVVRNFVDHLFRQPVDVIDMDRMRSESPCLRAAMAAAAARGHRTFVDAFDCTAVELPSSWEDYLRELKPRFRTRLRSLLKRLPDEQGAHFRRCEDPDELESELDQLFRLHQLRWLAAGEPGSFALAERRDFYRTVARRFLERGWLRLYRLSLDGQPAAYEFSFEYDRRLYFLQQSYDPRFADLSAGTALKAYVLRDCIERGVRAYDFLGDAADYKLGWGATVGSCTHLRIVRRGARTEWGVGAPRALQRLRSRIRAAAPEPLLRFKQRVQRGLLRRGNRRGELSAEANAG